MNHLHIRVLATMEESLLLWCLIVLGVLITSLGGCVFASGELSTNSTPYYAGAPLGIVDEILVNDGFSIGYSDSRENPLWVCYEVFAVSNPVSHARPSGFKVDLRTAAWVSYQDYTYSGYDRGHMAPNATIDYCYGQDAQLESFYMSNVCPQTPTLNRGIWATLESKVRDWANAFQKVWVITGPIFDKNLGTLPSGVKIPDAFYKILVNGDSSSAHVLSFVIPQGVTSGTQLTSWFASIDEIETRTGFDFLWLLPDDIENIVESTVPTKLWMTPPALVPPSPPASSACLDKLNAATYSDFHAVYGIGDVLSRRLVDAQPYAFIRDLDNVSGIGVKRMQAILDYFCPDR